MLYIYERVLINSYHSLEITLKNIKIQMYGCLIWVCKQPGLILTIENAPSFSASFISQGVSVSLSRSLSSSKFQGPFFCLCNSFPEPISSMTHLFYLCDFLYKLSLILLVLALNSLDFLTRIQILRLFKRGLIPDAVSPTYGASPFPPIWKLTLPTQRENVIYII